MEEKPWRANQAKEDPGEDEEEMGEQQEADDGWPFPGKEAPSTPRLMR